MNDNNTIKLNNYLLDLTLEDLNRQTFGNRHFVGMWGVESIFEEIYEEIKQKVRKGNLQKFVIEKLNCPKSTYQSWLYGYNPIPINQFYKFLLVWKDICNKSDKKFNNTWNKVFLNASKGLPQNKLVNFIKHHIYKKI